jgi:MOSC domain-containing protein YiiM
MKEGRFSARPWTHGDDDKLRKLAIAGASSRAIGVQMDRTEAAVRSRARRLVAVSVDGKHRFTKTTRRFITLTAGHGVERDAHYGPFVRHRYLARRNPRAPNLRQVHLIPSELFDALRTSGYDVCSGDLGENITTVGLDLEGLPLGTVLRIGASANVQLTGLRTPCVLIDRFKAGLKDWLRSGMSGPPFRAGVMAMVSEGGEVSAGDPIRAVLPAPLRLALPPL